jgi:hypothetical protein
LDIRPVIPGFTKGEVPESSPKCFLKVPLQGLFSALTGTIGAGIFATFGVSAPPFLKGLEKGATFFDLGENSLFAMPEPFDIPFWMRCGRESHPFRVHLWQEG